LPSTQGEFTLSEHQGQLILLYFGYLSCPDVCPNTSAQLAHLLDNLGAQADKVTVVFVTVDAKRDQLESITAYLQMFDERFIGIRTEGAPLATLLEQFGAQVAHEKVEGSAHAHSISHTASVFLITPDGNLLEQFLFGTPLANLQHDVELILKEEA
jgi:protein SCO1/2